MRSRSLTAGARLAAVRTDRQPVVTNGPAAGPSRPGAGTKCAGGAPVALPAYPGDDARGNDGRSSA